MPDQDNKLVKSKNLGSFSNTLITRRDRLSSSDLDDLYRLKVGDTRNFDISLFAFSKGARIGIEIYKFERPLRQVMKSIGKFDFRKLQKNKRNANLTLAGTLKQNTSVIIPELTLGNYLIRVFREKGDTRYQIQLADAYSVSLSPEPPISPIPPIPPTPPAPPAPRNKFQWSVTPSSFSVTFDLDFSRDQDENPVENEGLFQGAVTSGAYFPQFFNIPTALYQSADLISFKGSDGSTEYRAKLIGQDQVAEVMYIGFKVRSSINADPDSLSALKNALAIPGAVETQFNINPDTSSDLQTVELFSFNGIFRYTLEAIEKNFSLLENGVEGIPVSVVIGNELDNNIAGNSSFNNLQGKDGNDELQGKGGADILIGAAGNDILSGGGGADNFILDNAQGVSSDNVEYDVIKDWEAGSDNIGIPGNISQLKLMFNNVVGSSEIDTEIYYFDGSINRRIGIVKDTMNVIISRDFFVNFGQF